MTTIHNGPAKEQDTKARVDLRENRLKVIAAALSMMTALITAVAATLGIFWKQSAKDADAALGKADASSVRIQQLQQENAELETRLAAAQQALGELQASPTASAEAPADDVVYLDGLSPNESDFKPTSATVRGVSYGHALATPVGCKPYTNHQLSSVDYAISAKKLVRFRATVLLSEDVGDQTALEYFVRVNGTIVEQGSVEPGKVVNIDRTVKQEASTVRFSFASDDCPLERGEAIWANARLSRS
jgi:hypothetical protein